MILIKIIAEKEEQVEEEYQLALKLEFEKAQVAEVEKEEQEAIQSKNAINEGFKIGDFYFYKLGRSVIHQVKAQNWTTKADTDHESSSIFSFFIAHFKQNAKVILTPVKKLNQAYRTMFIHLQ